MRLSAGRLEGLRQDPDIREAFQVQAINQIAIQNIGGVLMFERAVSLEIDKAYMKLKAALAEERLPNNQ